MSEKEWPDWCKCTEGDICSDCGKPATHICVTASSLMCGVPLCDDCPFCTDFKHGKHRQVEHPIAKPITDDKQTET